MSRRPGRWALASLALLAVAAAAGVMLWTTRSGREPAGQARGGSLLGPATAPIDFLLLNARGLTYRFDRHPGGAWTLTGALADDLDQRAMNALADTLEAAVAGPLLPGTEPGDRRYAFNGPESLQLTVRRADGRQLDLSLGDLNPVTGTRYASGAGRRFCFTVPSRLRDRLAALPEAVRARQLLPGVDPRGVERITIEREGRAATLRREDGRWWLPAPDGPEAFGPLSARYNATYGDRRRTGPDGLWLQASTRAVETLIYEVTDTGVRELAPPERTQELVAGWGLSPPWRRVTLSGPAVRPAFAGLSGDDGQAPSIAFGPPLDDRFAPALRRGLVLVVDREAIATLLEPPVALLELGALPVYALGADVMEVTWEGRPLLRGSRRGEPGETDGRAAWLTDVPAADHWTGTENARHGLVRDLVVNLGRQAITAVLPPQVGADPLRPDGRAGVTLTFGAGPDARALHWEIGWLDQPVDGARAALWSPQDGRLVGIPEDLSVSLRNAAGLITPRQ